MNKIQTYQLYEPRPLDTSLSKIEKKNGESSFQAVFQDTLNSSSELKVSKHARARLANREVHINAGDWKKIAEKVSEARLKGITDSVVVTKEAALIVNTTSQTIITAMDRKEASTKLFSHINGAILID